MSVNDENNNIDYIIVETERFSDQYEHEKKTQMATFRKKIIDLLKAGYVPVGGINVACYCVPGGGSSSNQFIYSQALIKTN